MSRAALWLPPLLALAALGVLLGATGGPDLAGADNADREPLVNEQAQVAIARGTAFLMSIQRSDGAWSSNSGKKVNETYRVFTDGTDVPHVGVTSLAVLALLAGGHGPGRGPHGQALDRAVDFICDQVQPSSGYIASHGTRMYSHAFATLALAEVYGVSRRDKVRDKLQEAVEFTVKSQNETGGWRYVPFTNDSDMSVTVCQVVALRAARNVGIKVPRKTIDRALRYVIESAITTTGSRGRDGQSELGAFWYQPHDQRFNRPSFALCAAGLTTLFQAGLYDDESVQRHIEAHGIDKVPPPNIQRSVRYMEREYDEIHDRPGGPYHYFYYYGNYYAAQAMYQIGGKDPALWAAWYRKVRDHLLAMRRERIDKDTGRPHNYWPSNVDSNHAYGTACALLILQFPLDHLPIHQR
ncbi:MAG: hypothetical protein O2894_03875 [Planctomycetota bacterium]|nr:hypothetical protein [Planctomycetota bacterium]